MVSKIILQFPSLDDDTKIRLIKEFTRLITDNKKDLTEVLLALSSSEKANEQLTVQHADLNSQLSKLQVMYTTTQSEISTLKDTIKSLKEQAKSQPKNQGQPLTSDDPDLTAILKYAKERLAFHDAEMKRIDAL